MRRLVCQMMTSLNGRIDSPFEWMNELSEDHYADVEAAYRTFDTIVVGRVTSEEMAEFWPTALNDADASPAHRKMAKHMHGYRKLVITRDDEFIPKWNNAEAVVVRNDDDIIALATRLQNESGRDVHVAGGAQLAQTFARLNLIDAYRLYVIPNVSAGKLLFADVESSQALAPSGAKTFGNGATLMQYTAMRDGKPVAVPQSFKELLPA